MWAEIDQEMPDMWSIEQIASEQQEDNDLKLLYRMKANGEQKPPPKKLSALSRAAKVYFHDWQHIVIKPNNIMYRVWESADGIEVRHQMLLPPNYREMLFHHLHKAVDASHMGKRGTLRRLKRTYYWYRMGEDIRRWIRACQTCQTHNHSGKMPQASMQIKLSEESNERILKNAETDLAETGDKERNSNPENQKTPEPGKLCCRETTEIDNDFIREFQELNWQNEGSVNREMEGRRDRKSKVSKRKRTKYRKVSASILHPIHAQGSCENVKPPTSSTYSHQSQVNCRSRERENRDQDPPDGLGPALSDEAQTRARQERQIIQEIAVNAFCRAMKGTDTPFNRPYQA